MPVITKTKKTRRVSRFDFLLRLLAIYIDEANKCEKNRVYFAGCIVLGVGIEACLLAMAKWYPEKARRTKTYQQQKKKKMDELGLFELIKIALDLHWITPKLGKSLHEVRKIRNLVHPGKHLRFETGALVSRSNYQFCRRTFEVLSETLNHEVEESIRKQMIREGCTVRLTPEGIAKAEELLNVKKQNVSNVNNKEPGTAESKG